MPQTNAHNAQVLQCLRLDVPHWYARDDFRAWRQGHGQPCGPATWGDPHAAPTEYSDVFMTFDTAGDGAAWEGSDSTTLPADIYQEIGRLLAAHHLTYGLIWLTNVG